jgi:hypothetical protein
MGLDDFVTKSTVQLFKLLDLQEDFLEYDSSEWGRLVAYQHNKKVAW